MPEARYAGPFYGPTDVLRRGPDKSPYIEGAKRGLSRAGYLTWAHFDQILNRRTEVALEKLQRKAGIEPVTGQLGRGSHEVLERLKAPDGSPALDTVALILMEDGFDLKYPPIVMRPDDIVRASMASYLLDCERFKTILHYLQQRPMRSLGDKPSGGYYGDCSELVVAAAYWARVHTGVHVLDPAGYAFSGYGNSGSILSVNGGRKLPLDGIFEVGDIPIYGPAWKTRHVTICRKRGDAESAIFTSHGSEAGPYPSRLDYRRTIYGGRWGDLLCVVRPSLAP